MQQPNMSDSGLSVPSKHPLRFYLFATVIFLAIVAYSLASIIGKRGQAVIGILAFLSLAAAMSSYLRVVNIKTIGWGIAIPFSLAIANSPHPQSGWMLRSFTSLPAANFTQDFATTPLNIPGAGTGSLTSVLNNGVFNLAFSMPINNTQVLQGQNLTIAGSLQATGQVTAVPEPGSIVLCGLAAIGGLAVRRRAAVRRKQSAQ